MAGSTNLLREIHRWWRLAVTLQEQLDRIPRQIKARHTHLTTQEQAHQDEETHIKNLKVSIHEKESSIKTLLALVEKYSTQQQSSTSKKEFDAFTTEIKNTTSKSQQIEEEIIAMMEEVDRRAELLPGLKKAASQVRKTTAAFEKESKTKQVELTQELQEAQTKLAELESRLPPEILERYRRMVRVKGAEAFAVVDSRTCTGCSMQMTAQDFNEMLIDHVMMCRSCERFLYLPE